jgi:uncharacterized damage-inducible protein DinB
MDPVLLPYRTSAYNNAWANHRLLSACAPLSDAEFAAPRIGFFPSLRATLNHIVLVDLFYLDAMEGGRLGPAVFDDEEPHHSVLALHAAQSAADKRLIAVTNALDAEGLARIVDIHRDDHIQRERLDRLLLHVFEHQIHHRGQAHAMLSSTAIAPPQLDEFFSAMDAPVRAKEFAELGWTEDMIWGG